MNAPALCSDRSTWVSAAKCTTMCAPRTSGRADGAVGDVAQHEGVPRVVDDVVQVLEAAAICQLVERGDVPVGCVRSA